MEKVRLSEYLKKIDICLNCWRGLSIYPTHFFKKQIWEKRKVVLGQTKLTTMRSQPNYIEVLLL